jgi:hypothetical protein
VDVNTSASESAEAVRLLDVRNQTQYRTRSIEAPAYQLRQIPSSWSSFAALPPIVEAQEREAKCRKASARLTQILIDCSRHLSLEQSFCLPSFGCFVSFPASVIALPSACVFCLVVLVA